MPVASCLMQRRLIVVLLPVDDSKSTFETRQLKKVVLVLDGSPGIPPVSAMPPPQIRVPEQQAPKMSDV